MSNGEFKLGDFGTSRTLKDEEQSITLIGTSAYFPPEIRKHFKGEVIKLTQKDSETIDWYGFDTYSLGLCFAGAVCQIQSMGNYNKNIENLKKQFLIKEKENYNDPLVFQIIDLMIQQNQQDRLTPGELIKMAKALKTE